MTRVPFGEVVRACREQKNWSARKLSIAAGLSESYVGKLERGHVEPSLRVFASLCLALELSSQEIIFLIRQEAAGA